MKNEKRSILCVDYSDGGILFIGGQGVSALSFVIAIIVLIAARPPMSEAIADRHLRDRKRPPNTLGI